MILESRRPVTGFSEEFAIHQPRTYEEVMKKNGLKKEDINKQEVPYDHLPDILRKHQIKPLKLDPDVDYGTTCTFCNCVHNNQGSSGRNLDT
jgi:hypothetical protein